MMKKPAFFTLKICDQYSLKKKELHKDVNRIRMVQSGRSECPEEKKVSLAQDCLGKTIGRKVESSKKEDPRSKSVY